MNELIIETPRVFLPTLQPDLKYIAIHGGRGGGKTEHVCGMLVEEHILEPKFTVCGRETQKSLENSSKKEMEHKIQAMNAGYYFEVQDRRILARNGGKVIFEGLGNYTAESIKSLAKFDNIWVDEATGLSQSTINILRPTLRKKGAKFIFTWNPRFETDPIDQMFRGEHLPPRTLVVEANYPDNPFFPAELREEMEDDLRRDPSKYAHVWLGKYAQNSEARVFKNWRIEECIPSNGTVFRQGADFGFSIDPTVLLRCWIEGRNLYIDYEAYQLGCEIDRLPDLFMSVPESERWPLVADSSRPETISYLRNHGFPKILSAVKGARSVEEGVEFLKSFDIKVHPRCKHLINELTLYCYKVDKISGKVLPILADKDNHCIDALRYACEGVRRAKKESAVVTPLPVASAWR